MYKYVKRILDFLISIILLIILIIPMAIIAIIIKIDSKGKIIFKQARTGYKGKEFNIYKFRTMVEDNEIRNKDGDNEYTKFGKKLKRSSLDELPQLFNIIKGDMSIIGPRPWIPEYYENMTDEQRRRCDVLPGITGLAQVNGRNILNIFQKIDYDLEYVDNYSFPMDMKVMGLTIKAVCSKSGADQTKQGIREEVNALKKQNQKPKQKKKAKK